MGQKKLINKGILTISTLVLTGVLSACGVNQKNTPLSTAEQIDDMDKTALLYHATHDLYTVPQQYELEQQGITLEETTSSYWYFYFAEEGDEVAYYLSLAEKCFTKEEAIEIARTVKFR